MGILVSGYVAVSYIWKYITGRAYIGHSCQLASMIIGIMESYITKDLINYMIISGVEILGVRNIV